MTAFGLYFHWPYCTRICPYCDFNVVRNRDVDTAAWAFVLARDLDWLAAKTAGRKLTSIYFGGGTPSLMPPSLAGALIDQCTALWGLAPDAEITLEANPTDAEQARFAAFKTAGINRLSLGIQSLRDQALRFLGRNHSAAEARRALDLSLRLFDRTTLDLIYARPDQSLAQWQAELTEALATGIEHLSVYQLTVEPETAFQKAVARKAWALPEDPLQADFYDLTQGLCADAGLPAYEISNHATPGQESRHNLIYWHYQEYAGVGPGAHGRLLLDGTRYAVETRKAVGDYLALGQRDKFTLEPLSRAEQGAEYLLTGLRLTEGINLQAYEQLAGLRLPAKQVQYLGEMALIEVSDDILRLTAAGRRVLNRVVLELLASS